MIKKHFGINWSQFDDVICAPPIKYFKADDDEEIVNNLTTASTVTQTPPFKSSNQHSYFGLQ